MRNHPFEKGFGFLRAGGRPARFRGASSGHTFTSTFSLPSPEISFISYGLTGGKMDECILRSYFCKSSSLISLPISILIFLNYLTARK